MENHFIKSLATTPATHVLFLDMLEVAEVQNVVQRVCEAKKHPSNPILPLGDMHEWDCTRACPWEARTVLYDEEERIFKCWYGGSNGRATLAEKTSYFATGYAVSSDGLHWEKPKLGNFEYRGRKDNNICLWGWGSIIKDTTEKDPTKRYKAVIKGYPWNLQIRTAYSPDGIHWSEGKTFQKKGEAEGEASDPVALLKDEQAPPSERYKYVWQEKRKGTKAGPEKVRVKCMGSGPDLEKIDLKSHGIILHPNDSLEHENHFLALHHYGNYYVMAYEYGWYSPNGTGNFGEYSADVRLAVSRDCKTFKRIQPHQKLVARGHNGEWDDGFLVIGDKIIVKDGTIYLYYAGNGEELTSWPDENIPAESPKDFKSGMIRSSRMGLATLRLDGFTCLETKDGETPGFVTTQPIQVKNPGKVRLVLNLGDVFTRRSWIEVEILDARTGKTLDGFARQDCRDLDADSLCLPVIWNKADLGKIHAKQICLRFWLYGKARLYSFRFDPIK